MAISELNIKLMASQRLSDTDDGGGRMTGIEVVDGNVNNLFPDISRLDRVYGRVSLRKAFVAVDTDDQETYNGSHLILTNPAKDPLVNVCLFTTADPNDERVAAQDRIEAYVTQGPKFFGWLWGNQLEGSRSLLMFMPVDAENPEVGDVMFLLENENLADEYSQYVRITEITSEIITANTSGGATTRKIVTIEIGDPLRKTFHGGEITPLDTAVFPAMVFTTTVADAAKYYGAMELTQAVATGDITCNVNSIFTHLVPSAQSEAPLLDLSIGEAGPVIESGESRTVTIPSISVSDGTQLFFGRGMKPGSVSIAAYYNYIDDGAGILMKGTSVAGIVNYALGTITFVGSDSFTSAISFTAYVATSVSRITNTLFQDIDINNRGYNYTRILNPPPVPGTLVVDYMSQGKWYRLRDKGNGELVPDIAGTGTGTINYVTGSCLLTCAALPDNGSAVLYAWGNPIEIVEAVGDVTISVAEIDHTVAEFPVAPNSFSITWETGSGTATATDDGGGNLTGAATGTINYATGRCLFIPIAIPLANTSYTFDYDKYSNITESVMVEITGGMVSVQLTQYPVLPGSITLLMVMTVGGIPHTYSITDNGAGNVSAPGWSIDIKDFWSDWDGIMQISGLVGTVDTTTGLVVADISAATIDAMTFDPDYIIQEAV